MFDNIDNMKIMNVSTGTSKAYAKVTCRKTHSFSFRLSGTLQLNVCGKNYTANEKEMLFLPQGASYDFRTFPEGESRFLTINFQADITNPAVKIYSLESFPEADYIRNHLADMWKFGSQADKYQIYSYFYAILSHISNIEHMDYSARKKYKIIEPAVEYLKSHIYNSNLKADNLHLMCGISNTYFRNIFASNFGMSPQNYIIHRRISHAKSVIDSGEFDTIAEVAASVGYNDPLYFSRAFRKKYGASPMNINKES